MDTVDIGALGASLRHAYLFAPLSDAALRLLAAQLTVTHTAAGERVVREADRADALYVVLRGGVNVVKDNGHFLAYLGPGGFFGEMGLFTENARRTAHCEAVGDTACLVVHKDVLHRFCTEHPDSGLLIYGAIIRGLAERLQATSSDLALLMGTTVRDQAAVSALVRQARGLGG